MILATALLQIRLPKLYVQDPLKEERFSNLKPSDANSILIRVRTWLMLGGMAETRNSPETSEASINGDLGGLPGEAVLKPRH